MDLKNQLVESDSKLQEANKRIDEETKKSQEYETIKQELDMLKSNLDPSVSFCFIHNFLQIIDDMKASEGSGDKLRKVSQLPMYDTLSRTDPDEEVEYDSSQIPE